MTSLYFWCLQVLLNSLLCGLTLVSMNSTVILATRISTYVIDLGSAHTEGGSQRNIMVLALLL